MQEYLLTKYGLYYRPNSAGYTGIKEEAGRYDKEDESPDEGVIAIHEDTAPDYSPACWSDYKEKHLFDRINRLREQVRSLGAVPIT